MQSIGLIGGMSWESTSHYYTKLNRAIGAAKGGLHSAPLWLHSVDFAPIEVLQREGKWEEAGKQLATAAAALERAGAQGIALCTNTMHKIAPMISEAISVPFLHIAHATARALLDENVREILLLGTRFTMQEAFYKEVLIEQGIRVHIPQETAEIDRIIFEELCKGKVCEPSKAYYVRVIQEHLNAHPATQGVVLGCTEIGMLLEAKDAKIPLFDTTEIHVNALKEFILA
ncbi:MAG: amino acid racemase [Campylobacterales bacterium]|nr:amino acid racemase [Campylobacterales bacterium]